MFSSDSFSSYHHSGDHNASWSSQHGGLMQASYNGSSTFGVISELKFMAAKSSRQSTIILAAFNVISAAATAAGILYENYSNERRSPLRRTRRVNIFTCVQGPDVYPFALSLGIVAQGIIFAVSQAQGLGGLFQSGCTLISAIMWPAIFIVPYIQLVFAIETTLRALKRKPFPKRNKWTVAICLTVTKIALLATGIITFFIRAPNLCFAALFWFVAKWADIGFGILISIVVIMAICAVTLHVRLTRHSAIGDEERTSASRMVYYIALAIIPNALMIPFFAYLTFGNPFENSGDTGLTLSMVSTVASNVTGLMTGGLYLFLRSSSSSSISPKNMIDEYESQPIKYPIRIPKRSDTDFNSHMTKPVTVPQGIRQIEPKEKSPIYEPMNPIDSKVKTASGNVDTQWPLASDIAFKQTSMPRSSTDIPASSTLPPARKSLVSYALFPNSVEESRASNFLLPSTKYSRNTSEPSTNNNLDTLMPPPLTLSRGFRHRRESSMGSMATVQIGLRLSNFADIRPTTVGTVGAVEQTHELGCPNMPKTGSNRPSPLVNEEDTLPLLSPQSPRGTSQWDDRTKTLPPVPPQSQPEEEKALILNPTVYSPGSPARVRVPSPKGVGFNVPSRTRTTPIDSGEMNASVSRPRGNSAGKGATRTEWI